MTSYRRSSDPKPKAQTAGTPPSMLMSVGVLIAIMAIVYAFAAAGGLVTSAHIDSWYPTIQKPLLTPPNWIFPIVWNFLYFLIGLAAWLIWRTAGGVQRAGIAFALFSIQLTLNFAWSVVFFGLHNLGAAVLEIIALDAAIAATLFAFWQIDRFAALLLAPYLAWSLFATYLTTAIWLLNR